MALYVREAGRADASALVFLHGLWLSSAMWRPQFERLAQTYHCLAPDLPEHGHSTDIGRLTPENAGRVVADLIRARTRHGRAHVVGLSLGGLVALGLLRDAPEVIDHLLVSGCGAWGRVGPVIAALSKIGRPLLHLLKPAPLLSLGLRLSKVPPPSLRVLQGDVRRLQPEAIIHFAEEFVKMDLPRGVNAPILVLVGQREDFMMKRAARALSRELPARALLAPGLGHLWNLEAPDLFAETVQAWVSDQPVPRALLPYG